MPTERDCTPALRKLPGLTQGARSAPGQQHFGARSAARFGLLLLPGGPDTDPEGVARIFSVLMLIITAEGQVYDGDQMQDMLAAAGLSIVSRHEAPHMPTSVLLAERVG